MISGHYLWWLVSRASGIVALCLISLSVLLGLAMAARIVRGRGKRSVRALHEHLTVVALVAIAGHGLALLGDTWLKPGVDGITVPFALGYRPVWTGLGIIAGYLAVLLGPSYYLRRRIGTRLWRRMHRAIVLVWLLSVLHTLGAGSDAGTFWLRAIIALSAIPIVYALTLRLLSPRRPAGRDRDAVSVVSAPTRPRPRTRSTRAFASVPRS
ncbi:MAG TPA: ferric reductase-like transmembrane domain-containing protein [Solirubrobacteraceae bacterium]|nr:ferric reductase-like transmembrane domain-containing protein [Solirubrobacteraceae bacterium]